MNNDQNISLSGYSFFLLLFFHLDALIGNHVKLGVFEYSQKGKRQNDENSSR